MRAALVLVQPGRPDAGWTSLMHRRVNSGSVPKTLATQVEGVPQVPLHLRARSPALGADFLGGRGGGRNLKLLATETMSSGFRGLQSPESNWTNNSETVLEKDRGQTRRPCEPPRFGRPGGAQCVRRSPVIGSTRPEGDRSWPSRSHPRLLSREPVMWSCYVRPSSTSRVKSLRSWAKASTG